jgi:hypothetical protein
LINDEFCRQPLFWCGVMGMDSMHNTNPRGDHNPPHHTQGSANDTHAQSTMGNVRRYGDGVRGRFEQSLRPTATLLTFSRPLAGFPRYHTHRPPLRPPRVTRPDSPFEGTHGASNAGPSEQMHSHGRWFVKTWAETCAGDQFRLSLHEFSQMAYI